ncbi:MAG: cbb3-type cytochrome c oxidase subunit 3 [Bdellovibrionaceae bacterium]|nr:cbb3-type cytochrome c oxidase subunit 3 [Pseudobdellovibrionaceae bacterium]
MKSAAFAHYSDVPITLLGLILFVTVFMGVVWWTGLQANRRKYDVISKQILKDGE